MAFITEMALGFGRAIASQLSGDSNAILLSLKFLEEFDDPDSGGASTKEPMYGSLGVYARPKPPARGTDANPATNPKGETEVVAWVQEDRTYALAYRDLRLNALVNPASGEVGMVQYNGGFISMKTNDDGDGTNIVIYAPRGPLNAIEKASAISIDTTAGNAHVSIVHQEGQSLTMTKEGEIVMANAGGDASIVLKPNGEILLNGSAIVLNGSVHLGGSIPAAGVPILLSPPGPGVPSPNVTAAAAPV